MISNTQATKAQRYPILEISSGVDSYKFPKVIPQDRLAVANSILKALEKAKA